MLYTYDHSSPAGREAPICGMQRGTEVCTCTLTFAKSQPAAVRAWMRYGHQLVELHRALLSALFPYGGSAASIDPRAYAWVAWPRIRSKSLRNSAQPIPQAAFSRKPTINSPTMSGGMAPVLNVARIEVQPDQLVIELTNAKGIGSKRSRRRN